MRPRYSELPRIARVLVVLAAVSAIFFGGYAIGDFAHSCPNPAPLGRTDQEVSRALDSALPNGVSVDSASAFLARAGVEFGIERSKQKLRSYYAQDSNYVAGPVLQAIERDVTVSFFVTRAIQIHLYFDSAGRLARRDVHSVFTGP
jgi:hypothetical protein